MADWIAWIRQSAKLVSDNRSTFCHQCLVDPYGAGVIPPQRTPATFCLEVLPVVPAYPAFAVLPVEAVPFDRDECAVAWLRRVEQLEAATAYGSGRWMLCARCLRWGMYWANGRDQWIVTDAAGQGWCWRCLGLAGPIPPEVKQVVARQAVADPASLTWVRI